MSVVKAHTFLHVGIPVNDLDRSEEFYTSVLGLELSGPRYGKDAPVRLHCGSQPDPGQQVILFKRPEPIDRSPNEEDGDTHQAFIVTPEEFDLALEKFKEMGIFHRGPIVWRPGGQRTLYFFDPDRNYLQLADGDDAVVHQND